MSEKDTLFLFYLRLLQDDMPLDVSISAGKQLNVI